MLCRNRQLASCGYTVTQTQAYLAVSVGLLVCRVGRAYKVLASLRASYAETHTRKQTLAIGRIDSSQPALKLVIYYEFSHICAPGTFIDMKTKRISANYHFQAFHSFDQTFIHSFIRTITFISTCAHSRTASYSWPHTYKCKYMSGNAIIAVGIMIGGHTPFGVLCLQWPFVAWRVSKNDWYS